MRNFFRYLLALFVLAIGFYGASQHRLTEQHMGSEKIVEQQRVVSPIESSEFPRKDGLVRQTPLAALIDTDRSLSIEPPPDSLATISTLPEIARRESNSVPNVHDGNLPGNEVARPKRRPKSSPTVKTPVLLEEQSALSSSPKVRPGSPEVRGFGGAPSRAEPAEQRPADRPREVPTLASSDSNASIFPLPKLPPQPGDRFVVPDPAEQQPLSQVVEEWDPFDFMNETQALPANQPERRVASRAPSSLTITEQSSITTIHEIVPGDTLPKLAERYLGDRGRYQAIYEANTEILIDPRLLPIGVRIRIPTGMSREGSTESRTVHTSAPKPHDDPLDDLFGDSASERQVISDLEPIPPQSLPSHQFREWQYSIR